MTRALAGSLSAGLDVLDVDRRGLRRRAVFDLLADVDDIRAKTAMLQRRGIRVGMFMMLGYDGEDESDLAPQVLPALGNLIAERAWPLLHLGRVDEARLHIVEFRGFERFIQGRLLWEVPVIVQRLCGICPVSHHLAAAKATDMLVGARPLACHAGRLRRWGNVAFNLLASWMRLISDPQEREKQFARQMAVRSRRKLRASDSEKVVV